MANDWMRDALSKMFNEMDEITFDHESVCKGFLEDVCLAELFINTKLDRGDCKKTHSDKLKGDYDLVKTHNSVPVIKVLNELERELDNLVSDCDRRIRHANDRVAAQMSSRTLVALQEEIAQLNKTLSALDEESDKFAAEGEVDKMMDVVSQVDAVKLNKNEKEEELKKMLGNDSSGAQGMRVCDVCGALLASEDATDRRVADHFTGKMHLGYDKVRQALKSLRDRLKQHRSSTTTSRGAPRTERRISSRSRDRRDRERERDRRSRDREYERKREERYRDYERERDAQTSPRDEGVDRSRRASRNPSRSRGDDHRPRLDDRSRADPYYSSGSTSHRSSRRSDRGDSRRALHSPTEYASRSSNDNGGGSRYPLETRHRPLVSSSGLGGDKEEGEL